MCLLVQIFHILIFLTCVNCDVKYESLFYICKCIVYTDFGADKSKGVTARFGFSSKSHLTKLKKYVV